MNLLRKLRQSSKSPSGQKHREILRNRKIVLTGDFFPLDTANFVAKLHRHRAEVQLEMNEETELVICGKYPDWTLISTAEKMGASIVFLDSVSDLFSLSQKENGNFFWDN